MVSTAFEAFRASLEGPQDPRAITYDLHAFRQLVGNERAEAERLLDGRIRAGDVRAIETALGGGATDLVPALQTQIRAPRVDVRNAANRAIARLTGAEDAIGRLIAELRTGQPALRIQAAHELSKSDHPDAQAALAEALTDTETIVRVHAWNGIARHRALEKLASVRHSPLGVVKVKVFTNLPAVYQDGAAALRYVLDAMDGGASAVSLGLDQFPAGDGPEVAAFVASMDASVSAFDIAAIERMDEAHRAWAEAIVLGALTRRDGRAPPAIAALRPPNARAALEDALRSYGGDPAFEEAIRQAQARL